MDPVDTAVLLKELEPTVEQNLDRHLTVARDWMPHEYVPWSDGRNFSFMDGQAWSVEQSSLTPIARTAFEVNLLTEDNLPSYFHELNLAFGRDGAWGVWTKRWTAEEGRHAMCIRDYLLVTRGVDPERLERDRMATVQLGYDSGGKSLLSAAAYASFQELATRVSHRNTGRFAGDPVAERLLARIATDENLHMVFYRNLIQAALELVPDQTLRAITDEVAGFQMPGSTIPGFGRKAARMASAGIIDLRIHHDDVVMPLLRHWGVFELEGLGALGQQAREELVTVLSAIDARANRCVEMRERASSGRAPRGQGSD
jgi:acyl-[acyl-carrier-protein] desaturase